MLKTLFVFGTRPEAIKLAPVIHGMLERPDSFKPVVCVTAQHREMLDQALGFFGLPVHHDLNVMRPDQSLNAVSARILDQLDDVIGAVRPDLVCVQGDTVSTLMGALAAFYSRVQVMHVEAGLRSGRRDSPFPEEINRVLTTQLTDYHFAPTEAARAHLAAAGITANVWVTGNTAIDALHLGLGRIGVDSADDLTSIGTLDLNTRLVLVTSHRRESFGEPFARIVRAIGRIAENFADVKVLFPVHRNPNVQRVVRAALSGIANVYLCEPLEYPLLLRALRASTLVITDSGGLQEEAPALGKPVLVLRDVTERVEGVQAGTALLVGTDEEKIVAAAHTLLTDAAAYSRMAKAVNPYGDGRATERILHALLTRGPAG